MKARIQFAMLWMPILLVLAFTSAEAVETEAVINSAVREGNHELGQRLFGTMGKQQSVLEKIMKGANIKLKVFESDDKDESASLGFEYSYSKDFACYVFEGKEKRHAGLVMNFDANGNVAFDRNVNPNDFMDTNISLLWYRSKGGVLPKETDFKLLNQIEDTAVKAETITELERLPEWRELSETIQSQLTDQYYFDLSATGGLESDQSFEAKQYYYGLHIGLVAKGWNADKSVWAKFNIFDYPTALLRLISGADKHWRPRGSSFPEFLVGIDHIESDTGTPRETIADDNSAFERIRFEISFRTLAANYNDANAFLEANFRHYEEIDPSDRVKASGLDTYTYFTIALVMPKANGLYFSYTTGELPLDTKEDQVYEIGFKYKF
ncbi:MAG: hypothetical protein JW786_09820 [Desulfobacterales bacterium]|nr:hypothetical protein [Desulfobacterales bacterium]